MVIKLQGDCKMEKYHTKDISDSTFLITGGAGFIGSSIVDYLMFHNAKLVRVLDDLSTSTTEFISKYFNNSNFEFIKGSITNLETCKDAVKGIDYISHQAALGSVPRSIDNPIRTNEVNINGFLNILFSAKESSTLKRMVYAASSSTYGDSQVLPKKEGSEGKPLSPYAITKLVNELYAINFSKIYGFHTIGLRYFNIFGPKQLSNHAYAAVIPLFCKCFVEGTSPTINGDGKTSRDFTFIDNAVQANIKAMLANDLEQAEVFNIACGQQVNLLETVQLLRDISKKDIKEIFAPERKGDVKHSRADISKAHSLINYHPTVTFEEGLKRTYEWNKLFLKP